MYISNYSRNKLKQHIWHYWIHMWVNVWGEILCGIIFMFWPFWEKFRGIHFRTNGSIWYLAWTNGPTLGFSEFLPASNMIITRNYKFLVSVWVSGSLSAPPATSSQVPHQREITHLIILCNTSCLQVVLYDYFYCSLALPIFCISLI